MIAAVVLAAGMSSRMGRPKMTLPWGTTTVIGQVVNVLLRSGIAEVLVVTGGDRSLVEACLQDLPVRTVFNPRYEQNQMAYSLQVGLAGLPENAEAAMVALGDQPQIQEHIVRLVVQSFLDRRAALVIPSYQMRRGHPWIVARSLWDDILRLGEDSTLRDTLQRHASQILYVPVSSDSILRDLDSPADYAREKPV